MSGLFGASSSSGFTPLSLGTDLLAGWYIARANAQAIAAQGGQLSGASSSKTETSSVPAPWEPGAPPSPSEELKRRALATGSFLDEKDLEGYSDAEAPQDHKQLFALHQALKKLSAVAAEAADKTTSEFRRSFLDRRFGEGLAQITEFLSSASFTGVGVVAGKERTSIEGQQAIPRGKDVFRTRVLHEGAFDAEVTAFQGDRAFTITAKKLGVDIVVDIDLNEMGSTPRTLDNVAGFINGKLADAGIISRFKRVKIGTPDKNGVIPGQSFGFEITGSATEKLVFSAPASAQGALYVAGTSGKANAELKQVSAGQITKLSDLETGAPTVAGSSRLETVESDLEAQGLKISAAQAGPDGSMFVLAATDLSPAEGAAIRGDKDVVLAKYDSTGRRLWTRVLGASDTAEGASMAVGADGSVTIAGVMTGALGGTVDKGGKDGFVTKYNASGTELWTHRLGGLYDDSVDAVTMGSDGTIYVAGRTKGGLGVTHGGGSDAFVRAINPNGATKWTRQFGDGDEERATALAIADDGSLLVASVENGEGMLRKLSVADGVSAPIWEHSLGALDEGSINAIHADASGIYVTGAGRAGMTLAGSPEAHAGARDAFVIAFDDGVAPTVRFETFLGSSAEDVARDIVVADGSVYVAGYTDGQLPGGAAQSGARNAFAAKLDATTGALDWTTQITGRGGFSEGAALVYDGTGSSDLDAFGLPNGALFYQDERLIAQRTAARAGDYFYISVNGGHKRKITIDADDTLRELSFKVNAALVLDGEASVTRATDGDTLKIKPKAGSTVELFHGGAGQDLLQALGLEPGAVSAPSDDPEAEKIKTFGLGLAHTLNLNDRTAAEAAVKAIDTAMTNVRSAYRYLTRDPALEEALAKQPTGQAPAHMLAKIASYQEALARLGGL
jgi:hypothetical protein